MRCYVSYRYEGNKDRDIKPEYSWLICDMNTKSEYMTDEYFSSIMQGIIDVVSEKYALEDGEVTKEHIVLLHIERMER